MRRASIASCNRRGAENCLINKQQQASLKLQTRWSNHSTLGRYSFQLNGSLWLKVTSPVRGSKTMFFFNGMRFWTVVFILLRERVCLRFGTANQIASSRAFSKAPGCCESLPGTPASWSCVGTCVLRKRLRTRSRNTCETSCREFQNIILGSFDSDQRMFKVWSSRNENERINNGRHQ